MAKVIWSNEVVEQLGAIVTYIDWFDPVAAARMATRLFSLGESLAMFPDRGRPARHGVRELTTVPPYLLSYEVDGERVTILGVRYGARRPLD